MPKPDRKAVLLRLDPSIHDALAQWAADDLRSVNAEMEFLLKEAVRKAGRLKDSSNAARPGREER